MDPNSVGVAFWPISRHFSLTLNEESVSSTMITNSSGNFIISYFHGLFRSHYFGPAEPNPNSNIGHGLSLRLQGAIDAQGTTQKFVGVEKSSACISSERKEEKINISRFVSKI